MEIPAGLSRCADVTGIFDGHQLVFPGRNKASSSLSVEMQRQLQRVSFRISNAMSNRVRSIAVIQQTTQPVDEPCPLQHMTLWQSVSAPQCIATFGVQTSQVKQRIISNNLNWYTEQTSAPREWRCVRTTNGLCPLGCLSKGRRYGAAAIYCPASASSLFLVHPCPLHL